MKNLMDFYDKNDNLNKMMRIINGDTHVSLRIVDWFVTNYAKKYFTMFENTNPVTGNPTRFKVYNDYKLKLKCFQKKRFDSFCRFERLQIPCNDGNYVETTIGQLNFFKWAIENRILDYIIENYTDIENDMNSRNGTSRRKNNSDGQEMQQQNKTRKKREELSLSACKSLRKETVKIVVKFDF
jgi:hypothetical protein